MPVLRSLSNCASSPRGEEVPQQDGRGRFADAGNNFGPMMTGRLGEHSRAVIDTSPFGIGRRIDEADEAGLCDGAGTHGAGFKRDVDLGALQTVSTKHCTGHANRDDFRMGCRVEVAASAVCPFADDLSAGNNDCPDRDLSGISCLSGKGQRAAHWLGKGEAHRRDLGSARLTRQAFADMRAAFPSNTQISGLRAMARVCELTGKGRQVGHNVSHANNKTKRTFLPNLQNVTLLSDTLGEGVKLRVSTHGLRTVEHVGGLDNWLAKASDDLLSLKVQRLKRKIAKAKTATQAAA